MICGFFMDATTQSLIILVGPMGAGKTTIGRLLAQQLGYQFYDSDSEIEAAAGVSVGWIFEKEGEAGFRQRESKILDKLTRCSHTVLATGGGAVMTPINREFFKRGMVIYLRAEVEVQYERTCRDRNRPLLQTENPKQRLADLFAIRDPIYQQLADVVITTGHTSPKRMVHDLMAQLSSCFDAPKSTVNDINFLS